MKAKGFMDFSLWGSILSWAVLCSIFIFGCSPPLQTLITLGNEQKAQQNYVAKQEQRFSLLLKEAKTGQIKQGRSATQIIQRYGEPVLINEDKTPEQKKGPSTWLYRKPAAYINSPKVYLDFDENDILTAIRIKESNAG